MEWQVRSLAGLGHSPSTVSKKKAGVSLWVLAVAPASADPHYKPCSEETTLDFLVFGGGGGGLASRLLGSGGATSTEFLGLLFS